MVHRTSQSTQDWVARLASRCCNLRLGGNPRFMSIPSEPRFQPSEQARPHSPTAGEPEVCGETADDEILGDVGIRPNRASRERRAGQIAASAAEGDQAEEYDSRPSTQELLAQWRTRERSLYQARLKVGRAKVALGTAVREKQTRARALAETEQAVLATGDAAAVAFLLDAWREEAAAPILEPDGSGSQRRTGRARRRSSPGDGAPQGKRHR